MSVPSSGLRPPSPRGSGEKGNGDRSLPVAGYPSPMEPFIPPPPDQSYWQASPDLQALLRRKLSAAAYAWAEQQLEEMGERAAMEVAPLAAIADREQPRLITHDSRGQRINRVEYHSAYQEMERVAYGSGMIAMKYQTHEHS